jgi:hypothetical protein
MTVLFNVSENECNKKLKGFYINKIYDGRQFKDDIVTKSIANSKSSYFKSAFVEELGSFRVIYPKKRG